MDFWVVVPVYNEEKLVRSCLESLLAQSDSDFGIVVVDNASTDGSARIVREVAAAHPDRRIDLVAEAEKGVGFAADTGFRHALAQGATYLARTDADCLAHPDWVRRIKKRRDDGFLLVAGGVHTRTDDEHYSRKFRVLGLAFKPLSMFAGLLAKVDDGTPEKRPYLLIGNNFAVDAQVYQKCGGYPRMHMNDGPTDVPFHVAVRRVIGGRNSAHAPEVVVYHSARRYAVFGAVNGAKWYNGRQYKPQDPSMIDVR